MSALPPASASVLEGVPFTMLRIVDRTLPKLTVFAGVRLVVDICFTFKQFPIILYTRVGILPTVSYTTGGMQVNGEQHGAIRELAGIPTPVPTGWASGRTPTTAGEISGSARVAPAGVGPGGQPLRHGIHGVPA